MANSSEECIITSDREVPTALIHSASRIDDLRAAVRVFRGWGPETAALKASCLKSLARHKENVNEIISLLEALQKLQGHKKEEKARAKYLKLHCDFILNNIPDRFNCPNQVTKPGLKDGEVHKIPIVQVNGVTECGVTNKVSSIPKVPYLSLDEFEKVPKYMKGRVTYDKINVFIDALNEVVSSKYAIFKKKKSTLQRKEANLWNEFYKQELKETKGMFFCVGDDFRNFKGSALDKVSLNMITILRHCGRLREVRTGGIVRYVLSF